MTVEAPPHNIPHPTLPPLLRGPQLWTRALRWLLRADVPLPPLSAAEIEAETAHNYRWNFAVNLLDGTHFWFGASFISGATILPLFISKLTDNPLAIGLLGVVASSGWLLPQLFTANTVQHLPRNKAVVVNLGLFLERLPVWVMVLAALVAGQSPQLALALFLLAYAWQSFGAGAVAISWQDMMANCFPIERRGRFFGTTSFLGAGLGILGATLSARLLEAAPFPLNFARAFTVAATFILVSWGYLALTRETPRPRAQPPQSDRDFLRQLPAILRRDHNFRRFMLSRAVAALGGMGGAFITIAALARWQIPDSTVGLYTAIMLVGQSLGNLVPGLLSDRYGHKPALIVSGLSSALAFLIAWLAPTPAWYYAVFGLIGFANGVGIISGMLIVMEFGTAEQRPTYIGLANTIGGLVGAGAPLLGAALAAWSYSGLFALSGLAILLSVGQLILRVQDPRHKAVRG